MQNIIEAQKEVEVNSKQKSIKDFFHNIQAKVPKDSEKMNRLKNVLDILDEQDQSKRVENVVLPKV